MSDLQGCVVRDGGEAAVALSVRRGARGAEQLSKTIVTFEAALASRGDCLKLDAEGAAVLVLQIPAGDAPAILGAYSDLQDRSFVVALIEVA